MRCQDLHEHFVEVGPFVEWEREIDGIKIGDPDRQLTTLATVWNPTWPALRLAHEQGAEMVVAHESIFVLGGAKQEAEAALESEQAKLAWLRESGLVVYRCHDLWDAFPGIGIRWTWQRGLDLEGTVVTDHYPLLITEIKPRPLRALARHILERIAPLGQTHVAVAGDLDQTVSRVATGTGVTPDPITMWKLGADVGVMTDDYFLYVREGAHAQEEGFPMISVNHGVAEEWGIENLSTYLAEQFADLTVFHIPQRCPYQMLAL